MLHVRQTRLPGSRRKPRALALFDIDYTMFGIASSVLGTDSPLYQEKFWDSSFGGDFDPSKEGFGEVWGLARGLVPDAKSFAESRVLGPDSVLSTSHPLFGVDSPLDFSFGIISDGPSLTEDIFSQNGHALNQTAQVEAVRYLRMASDFNPRWHILDTAIYTCLKKYDERTLETFNGWKLNPVQQHCTDYGRKDIMAQNILDFYANKGSSIFDYIFMADDQKGNLQVVKEAPNLGGKYTWGAPYRPREEISLDSVFVAYPHGGVSYEVRPRGDGSFPMNCGGCYYVNVSGAQVPPFTGDPASEGNPATEVGPFQAMIAGIGRDNYFSTIAADGTLTGSHPLQEQGIAAP